MEWRLRCSRRSRRCLLRPACVPPSLGDGRLPRMPFLSRVRPRVTASVPNRLANLVERLVESGGGAAERQLELNRRAVAQPLHRDPDHRHPAAPHLGHRVARQGPRRREDRLGARRSRATGFATASPACSRRTAGAGPPSGRRGRPFASGASRDRPARRASRRDRRREGARARGLAARRPSAARCRSAPVADRGRARTRAGSALPHGRGSTRAPRASSPPPARPSRSPRREAAPRSRRPRPKGARPGWGGGTGARPPATPPGAPPAWTSSTPSSPRPWSGRSRPRAAGRSRRAPVAAAAIAISTGLPGDMPEAAHVEKRLLERHPLDHGRRVPEDPKELARRLYVRVEVRLDDHELGAEAPRLLGRHRRANAERARLVRRRHDDPRAHRDRLPAQRGVVALRDRGEERVEVRVDDRRLFEHEHMFASVSRGRLRRLMSLGRHIARLLSALRSWPDAVVATTTAGRRHRAGRRPTRRPQPKPAPAARKDRPDRQTPTIPRRRRIWLTTGEQLKPVERDLGGGDEVEAAAEALVEGPTAKEEGGNLDAASEIPAGTRGRRASRWMDGTALVEVSDDFLGSVPAEPSKRTCRRRRRRSTPGSARSPTRSPSSTTSSPRRSSRAASRPGRRATATTSPSRQGGPPPITKARARRQPGIKAIQKRLVELRYLPPGAVDGLNGYRTQQAVIAFQSWRGPRARRHRRPADQAGARSSAKPPSAQVSRALDPHRGLSRRRAWR